jgi:hypothetical protein
VASLAFAMQFLDTAVGVPAPPAVLAPSREQPSLPSVARPADGGAAGAGAPVPLIAPLLTAGSLSGAAESADVARVAEDIARAAVSVSRPLCGLEEVVAALADSVTSAVRGAGGDPTATATATATREVLFPLQLLLAAARRAPKVPIVDRVFRELSRRCISSRSVDAARGAAALAVAAWGRTAALGRGRILLYDLLYSVDAAAPAEYVRAVDALWREFHAAGVVLVGGGERGGVSNVLEAAIVSTVRQLLASVDGTGDSTDLSTPTLALRSALDDVVPTVADGEDAGSRAMRDALSPAGEDTAFCGRLALALEARRMGSARAYDELLAARAWPAVADAAVVHDVYAGETHVRQDEGAAASLSRAILAAGSVLAALDRNGGDASLGQGVAVVEQRLVGMLECTELPTAARAAAARALVWSTLGLFDGPHSSPPRGRTPAGLKCALDGVSAWATGSAGDVLPVGARDRDALHCLLQHHRGRRPQTGS